MISLGGCADQLVHSDTAHPFTCCPALPAHYINLFLIAPDTSSCAPPPTASCACQCCDFRWEDFVVHMMLLSSLQWLRTCLLLAVLHYPALCRLFVVQE